MADRVRQASWRKVSRLIQLARDQHDLQSGNFDLESENINSARGTKNFLKRVEEDIGLVKAKYL
jgi:hypothetical protein